MDSIAFEVISNIEQFDRIKDKWNKLSLQHYNYSFFLSHEWFDLWLKHFGRMTDLYFIIIYEVDMPVLIVPLIRHTVKKNRINIQQLELAGNFFSPFRYLITDLRNGDKILVLIKKLLKFIKTNKIVKWDMLSFYGIPEEQKQAEKLMAVAVANKLYCYDEMAYGDWYEDSIPEKYEDYFKSLPKKLRKDIVYCQRRMEREGQLLFELYDNNDDLDSIMNVYFSLYANSWQEKEKYEPDFLRNLTRLAACKNSLRLGFLKFNNKPIACQFWLNVNKTSYIFKIFYDQKYSKYSPGKVLTAKMFKSAIEADHVDLIDFVMGDESYKKDWLPKRRTRRHVTIYGNTIKGRFMQIVDRGIKPVIKKMVKDGETK
ncbi:MAG: GNAT family N-acetyltransferase [Proteobacteria bacterium]|nr:GNAT family N-acetyltransferase [Pseudomonadota bacterium]MBU4035143.1 GNAT family N-acetyltransferase [Pseudomonadota bacterium]